jgi:hypothetical protein
MVEGLMPERAVDRLQKAGICLFSVKKIEKKQILFCINKKDLEKAFAIYPNMCYNNKCESVYSFTRVGAMSARERKIVGQRLLGVGLGICVFFALFFNAAEYLFRIDVVGTDIYRREALEILQANGVRLYAPYVSGKEDVICSKILGLDGVEFCSVQKRGNTLRVEIRLNAFSKDNRENGALLSPRDGVIENVVALGGTPLKKKGERVTAGEIVVGDYFTSGDGETLERTKTTVVAKVKLLCEERIVGETLETSTAQARLFVENIGGRIEEMTPDGDGVVVKYSLVLKKNM